MNIHNWTWTDIKWSEVERYVFRLQKQIYSASKLSDFKVLRKMQDLILRSWQAKLLAVRRVTQDNKGKNTAGIDGIKKLSPPERLQLAKQLQLGTPSQPVRRVWIPKLGTKEKRPLGIPTLYDRALQALVHMAMEPEWEAPFEPNSYGFRRGRCAHDAIHQIMVSIQQKPKYVLDAHIAKCFDRIDHQALLDKAGYQGILRKQLFSWLKAGVLDQGIFEESTQGTPQGGVISPLLANIALHGMEYMLKDFIETLPIRAPGGYLYGKRDKRNSLSVIRYADDFVVAHASKEIVLKCKKLLEDWLNPIGLELKSEKTRISHTLEPTLSEDGKAGFDFLGFTIRQFKSKYESAFTPRGQSLGFRTLIWPSHKSQQRHQKVLRDLIKLYQKAKPETLIKRLNPIIIGWTNYFAVSNAVTTNTFAHQDNLLYLKLRKWAKRQKGSSKKAFFKYWSRQSGRLEFRTKETRLTFHRDWTKDKSLSNYVKVRSDASPFDGNSLYWVQRLEYMPDISSSEAILLRRQKGKCAWCHTFFLPGDLIEKDHIIPKSKGGKDTYQNLQLLHRHCHDQKTALDLREGASKPNGGLISSSRMKRKFHVRFRRRGFLW